MKAIDLHLHTRSTISDSHFDFSIDSLKRHIKQLELDIIGITNHNLFDLEQFKYIDNNIDIKVLPGIEINFENGHLLLLSENEKLEDFSKKCEEINLRIKSPNDTIKKNELENIFGDLSNYLLIPHNPKRPKVPIPVIRDMKDYISAVEVSSIKDFLREYIDNKEFTPVWFSDIRLSDKVNNKKRGRVFLDIGESKLSSIKFALKHREKVKLTKNESNSLFPINNNGDLVSTGLNILLGARSSGKSHFLNNLYENNQNVKYIRQFSLLDKYESDLKDFKSRLNNENSNISEAKFLDFKTLIEEMVEVNISNHENEVNSYVKSLIKFATEEERRDSFSKSNLYTQDTFAIKNTDSIDKLIGSVETILENKEYKEIVEKYIDIENLEALIIELCKRSNKIHKKNIYLNKVNKIIKESKEELQVKTASNNIPDINLNEYLIDIDKIRKFNNICNLVKRNEVTKLEEIGRFDLVMISGEYKNVTEIKNNTKTKVALSDIFKSHYKNGYNYLNELKKLDIPRTEYWKYFINVRFDIWNEYNLSASGGERAEYNLLNEIKTAFEYEMLLLDEPESSFDNIFLNTEVNNLIKDISKKMPVILATHNNTVGISINPDYLLYTLRQPKDDDIIFKVFSGNIDSEYLVSFDDSDDKISTTEVLMDSLEAGELAYKERKKIYELHEDRK
ncbi:PHP domain-containing protein [Anaerococcus sp.]|uniref:PHP domain-containing protein n=1 Tax=Anaerococcus sp. TaxID=1872515 RepID=UPI00280AA970|nr:PHP domain-containing protein [Anaerococcus sp.]MDU3177390.1 hypothetical protein [Anaerococcus sp.]